MPLQIQPPKTEEFIRCRALVFDHNFLQHGIGSLSEKVQHAILKNYYCPNPSCQEINLGRFVADIADQNGVIEIQTKGFGQMRKKLSFFLEHYPVRIVYPVVLVKWVVWIDPQTGEIISRRKSPKKTAAYDLFRELYSILDLLWQEKFSLTLPLLESEEYRLLDGYDKNPKKGSSRSQMVPSSILGEVALNSPSDLLQFLPDDLPPEFCSSDIRNLCRLNSRQTSYFLLVLRKLGLIEQVGIKNRFYLYRVKEQILP